MKQLKKNLTGRVDWIGVRNKYFAAIIAPQNPLEVDGAYIEGIQESNWKEWR